MSGMDDPNLINFSSDESFDSSLKKPNNNEPSVQPLRLENEYKGYAKNTLRWGQEEQAGANDDPFEAMEKEVQLMARLKTQDSNEANNLLRTNNVSTLCSLLHLEEKSPKTTTGAQFSLHTISGSDSSSIDIVTEARNSVKLTKQALLKKNLNHEQENLEPYIPEAIRSSLDSTELCLIDAATTEYSPFGDPSIFNTSSLSAESALQFVDDDIVSEEEQKSQDAKKLFEADLEMLKLPILDKLDKKKTVRQEAANTNCYSLADWNVLKARSNAKYADIEESYQKNKFPEVTEDVHALDASNAELRKSSRDKNEENLAKSVELTSKPIEKQLTFAVESNDKNQKSEVLLAAIEALRKCCKYIDETSNIANFPKDCSSSLPLSTNTPNAAETIMSNGTVFQNLITELTTNLHSEQSKCSQNVSSVKPSMNKKPANRKSGLTFDSIKANKSDDTLLLKPANTSKFVSNSRIRETEKVPQQAATKPLLKSGTIIPTTDRCSKSETIQCSSQIRNKSNILPSHLIHKPNQRKLSMGMKDYSNSCLTITNKKPASESTPITVRVSSARASMGASRFAANAVNKNSKKSIGALAPIDEAPAVAEFKTNSHLKPKLNGKQSNISGAFSARNKTPNMSNNNIKPNAKAQQATNSLRRTATFEVSGRNKETKRP